MFISVIIPAYNEEGNIITTLQALEKQTLGPDLFEVIVVNDGSTDRTQELLEAYRGKLSLTVLNQKNQGQGNARNHGLKKAKGEVILFLGADAYADMKLLEEHYETHMQYGDESIGVLGFATWDPALDPTPLMYFMEHGGHQFAYQKAARMEPYADSPYPELDYRFFYTINISLKRSLLEKDTFDGNFTSYGWEDIELGYRLVQKHNFRLLYNSKATVLHHEFVSEDRWRKKMFLTGKNGIYFMKQYPELKVLPQGMKKKLFQCITHAPIPGLLEKLYKTIPNKHTAYLYYYVVMKRYILQGMQEGESTWKSQRDDVQ